MAVKASVTITISKYRDTDNVTRYYKLQASTAPVPAKPTTLTPSSGWTDTEPAYTSGSTNTLYFVDRYIFSDETFQYTEVSQSSSYEASKEAYNKAQAAQDELDALEIGGRNYILDSKDEIIIELTPNSYKAYRYEISDALKILDQETKTFTFSYEAYYEREDETSTTPVQLQAYFRMNSGSEAMSMLPNLGHATKTWARYYGTKSLNEGYTISQIDFLYVRIEGKIGDKIHIRKVKAEIGNKVSDWTQAPEDFDNELSNIKSSLSEVIVGTQTDTTASWTGVASFNSLENGRQITYWLPQTSASNATLNLTLNDSTQTGAKPLYYGGTTRIGTQYPAGSVVHLTYRTNVTIGSTTIAEGWWADANYNTNDTDRLRFVNSIKAKTAIAAATLIVGDDNSFFKLEPGSIFNIDKPILWANSSISAGSTGTNNYLSMPSCPLLNNTSSEWTETQYKTLYLVGVLNGNKFTADSNILFTTTIPTEEDSKYYISLGYMYSTTKMYLYPEHPIYKFSNGSFKNIAQIANEVTLDLNKVLNQKDQNGGKFIYLDECSDEPFASIRMLGETNQQTRELGQNLYDYRDISKDAYAISEGVVADNEGWITITGDNESGSSKIYKNYFTNNLNIDYDTNYAVIVEIKSVTGTGHLYPASSSDDWGQFSEQYNYAFSELTNNSVVKRIIKSKASDEVLLYGLRTFCSFNVGESGSITFRLSVLANTDISVENFEYEPFGEMPSRNYPGEITNLQCRNKFNVDNLYLVSGSSTTTTLVMENGKAIMTAIQTTRCSIYWKCCIWM